ncbi:MAG: urate hydroxylase PuuD [Bradyrhizobium sp.]
MEFVQLGLGRWLHIAAGFMWVGLLYYLNFVNVAAAKAAAADGTAACITKHVMPRTLLFFRWAAVVTWLAGAMLLGSHFLDAFLFRQRAYIPIGIGAWLGTIMLLNVWGLIWPNQKRVLGMVPATDEEKSRARRVAFLASRTNVMLSLPLLFFMSASGGQFRTAMF